MPTPEPQERVLVHRSSQPCRVTNLPGGESITVRMISEDGYVRDHVVHNPGTDPLSFTITPSASAVDSEKPRVRPGRPCCAECGGPVLVTNGGAAAHVNLDGRIKSFAADDAYRHLAVLSHDMSTLWWWEGDRMASLFERPFPEELRELVQAQEGGA